MDLFLGTLFIVVCILLIVVVLLQKGRGGGLGAALGGMGTTAFGTKTGDVFTWVTIVLTALFLLLAIGATLAYRPKPKTVMPPTFTPPADEIEGPRTVEITCRTPGVTIYYTLDGSEPTKTNAQVYDARKPIRVQPGTVLKARAYRAGWADSRVTTGRYRKRGEPPAPPTTSTAPPTTSPAPTTSTAPAGSSG